jgi:hypothetical protein
MKAFIYLKSGTVIETDVDEISTKSTSGQVTTINWTKAEKGLRMLCCNPEDVSAITVKI